MVFPFFCKIFGLLLSFCSLFSAKISVSLIFSLHWLCSSFYLCLFNEPLLHVLKKAKHSYHWHMNIMYKWKLHVYYPWGSLSLSSYTVSQPLSTYQCNLKALLIRGVFENHRLVQKRTTLTLVLSHVNNRRS